MRNSWSDVALICGGRALPRKEQHVNEQTLFAEALERANPQDRAVFLDQACQGDSAVRGRIERLLTQHEHAGNFLESPLPRPQPTMDEPVSERPSTIIGPYKVLEQIGEGGFGVVFMAEQTQPVRRKVALKILKAGMDTRQVIARFEAERQALAMMDHPNIAKVHDGGTTPSGRPYFVMELVKGVPITEFCDQNHLPLRQRLELFIPVCQAVQHAHQKGIIHRDLKPSNVVVALYDGKPVPKVIDFGVAKAAGQSLTDKTLFTGFGAIIGTLEYMSPEQAEINQLDVDTRSDIYALGVLLYELVAGTTPLERKRVKESGMMEALRIIREEEAPTLSNRLGTTQDLPAIAANRGLEPAKLTKLARGELNWIVMKALEKDRGRRYETANGLAMDVQRYLADEPVHACPPSTWYRCRKLARRNRRTLTMVSALALAAFVGVGALAVSTALVWRADQDVWKANQELRRDSYFHRIDIAYNARSADNLSRALKYLEECPEALRGWEWNYLNRLCRFEPLILRDEIEVHGVAFSPPDGELLASGNGNGTIKIWNSKTGKLVQELLAAHSDAIVSVAFHPDGKHLASRGADLKLKVWDLKAPGEAVWTEPCDAVRKYGAAYTIAFSPDGRLLAAGSDGVVKVWDWKKNQLLQSLPGDDFHPIPVAFSRDGRLATGISSEGVKLWDPQTGTPFGTLEHRGPISALAFSANSEWLASAGYDRTVKILDSKTGGLLRSLLHPGNQPECIAISPDGRRLASGGEDKKVRIWDPATKREILSLPGHTDRCECLAFSPDGYRLASASNDGTIRIWDGTPLRGDERGEEMFTFTEHSDEVRHVAFSPDGLRIASTGSDGLVKVWDAQTGRVSTEFSDHNKAAGHKTAVFCLAWDTKRDRIASASGIGPVRVWNARTERPLFSLLPTPMPYVAVAFSPDCRYLIAGNTDGAVRVWNGETGQEVGTLGTHKREVVGLVFSPDGKHLASASRDGIVKLWDGTRLNEKQEPCHELHARVPGASVNVAFSPDGQRLAAGGEENTVKIWDVKTGNQLQSPFGGHKGEVYTLAFSPDDGGRWIASGGEDTTVKFWDSHTGKLVHTFRGHLGLVSSVAFSPDGKFLVSGSRDHNVKVWDLSLLREVSRR
jgi:WD40 repeat protein/serine/threonine protein kinase